MDLFKYQDKEYKVFNDKLLKTNQYDTIGIRVPVLKEIAKNLSISNYKDYISNNHTYYEEVMIHGLILGYIKIPFNELLSLLDIFIPLIDNWAVNDTVCANLKAFKLNQEEGYKYIKKLLKGDSWSIRFGLVLLLDHYINENYIDEILKICSKVDNTDYYVMMANSWLISSCYIKFKDKTLKLLKSNKLDKIVLNKAISKICDSYRVTKKEKDYLKTIRK